MSDATVREATLEDVGDIVGIARRAWHDTYGPILEAETIETALEEWYQSEGVRSAIEDESVAYFVAEDSGAVVGYLSGKPEGDGETATIGALYADPERRGEGIGTALLARFEAVCQESECNRVELRALSDNEIGGSFYRSRGFEAVGTDETELFGEQVTETLFCRPLE